MTIRCVLNGACGKMGQMISALSKKSNEIEILFPVEHENHSLLNTDYGKFLNNSENGVKIISIKDLEDKEFDLIVDFSSPLSFRKIAELALNKKVPFVSGTTGVDIKDIEFAKEISSQIPVIYSPNMSTGINILFSILEQISAVTSSFDTEIVEMHHKHKKDAPSGTALKIGEIIAKGRNIDLSSSSLFGRHGITGEREPGTICFHALRGGDVVGEHTVIFAGNHERIEITHKAHSREIFADGALKAACWIYQKPAGYYSMKDVLGL